MINKTSTGEIRVATWNADGIVNRKNELEVFLEKDDISILLVNETFLKPHITFRLKGLHSVRKDRQAARGGGVAVFYRSSLAATKLEFNTQLEAVGVLTKVGDIELTFIAIYSPPKDDLQTTDIRLLFKRPGTTIIGGDWNEKHPSWGSRMQTKKGLDLQRVVDNIPSAEIWCPEDFTSIPARDHWRGDVIDFFITHRLEGHLSIRTIHELSSDHFPVMITLQGWIRFAWLSRSIRCPTSSLQKEFIEEETLPFTSEIQKILADCSVETVSSIHNR